MTKRILTDCFNRHIEALRPPQPADPARRLPPRPRRLKRLAGKKARPRIFAQAVQQENGNWSVTESEKYSISYHHRPLAADKTLAAALVMLHQWQIDKMRREEYKRAEEPLDEHGDHYRAVIQQEGLGVLLQEAARPAVPAEKPPSSPIDGRGPRSRRDLPKLF